MFNIIKKGNSGLKQDAVSPHAQRVSNGIYGNPTIFLNPPLTKDEFQALIDNYDASLVAAANRDKGKVKIKNDDHKKLNTGVDRIFNFALNIVGTNVEIAVISGFPFAKFPTPVGNMPAPIGLSVKSPATGQGKIIFKKVKGAKSYLLLYAPFVDQNWNSAIITETRHLLENLNPLTMYKFQVAAVGSDGQGPFSSEVKAPII